MTSISAAIAMRKTSTGIGFITPVVGLTAQELNSSYNYRVFAC